MNTLVGFLIVALASTGCATASSGAASNPDRASELRPTPSRAKHDVPAIYAKGCRQENQSSAVLRCTWGEKNAATKIAVVGDSKAAQWTDAIAPMVHEQNWRVVSYIKSACDFADVDQDLRPGAPHPTCRPWVRKVLKAITGPERPDYVILSQRGTRVRDDRRNLAGERDRMRKAMIASWKKLTAVGIRIVVVADNPDPAMEVHECVAEHGPKSKRCTFDTAAGVSRSAAPLQLEVTRALSGRRITTGESVPRGFRAPVQVDLLEEVCPTETCRPVTGDILKYRQGSHLTRTYVRSLTAALRELFAAAGIPTRR